MHGKRWSIVIAPEIVDPFPNCWSSGKPKGISMGRSRHVNSAPDQFTLTHSAATDFIWIKVVFLYHVSEQSFFKNNFVPFIRFDL